MVSCVVSGCGESLWQTINSQIVGGRYGFSRS